MQKSIQEIFSLFQLHFVTIHARNSMVYRLRVQGTEEHDYLTSSTAWQASGARYARQRAERATVYSLVYRHLETHLLWIVFNLSIKLLLL